MESFASEARQILQKQTGMPAELELNVLALEAAEINLLLTAVPTPAP
ncbi:hypothetical protein [Hymenobacter cellulosivorans]|uniref:Uncharacterized protein n=1 Tax=Hymenobacter cellulosivorans TaxID=2932249 RepID=A0ABY4F7W9_9BACT|nr:hypothetical protein [Hymenobacter cellulosivorans]UOQ52618.1 hypothetical protein MUN80_23065 [Hymenobacter cellulosivorans]